MIHYKEILHTLKPEQKMEFLERALANSAELQSQLVHYFTKKEIVVKSESTNDFNRTVEELIEEYKAELEKLDLEEPDYDRWNDRNDRYYEQWEVDSEVIEDEVSELFDDFSAEIVNNVSLGAIELALAQLTGLLIACEIAEVDDPYDNLGGNPNESFLEYFDRVAQEARNEIIKTIFNPDIVSHSIIETAQYLKNKTNENTHTTSYDMLMESLLHSNTGSCETVYTKFKDDKESISIFPNTFLSAVKVAKPDLWLREAENICIHNVRVATELLAYQSKNDLNAFHQDAKKLFAIFPNELVNIIAQTVDATIDLDFTKEIYKYGISKSHDIEMYKQLAALLTEDEKHDFIEQYKHEYTKYFYVKLLEQEEKFEQILDYVQKYNGHLTTYSEIMQPIIHKYPKECFDILQPQVKTYLDTNMNRESYAQAASVLKFLASDIRNLEEISKFATQLCTLYPRRSALRDELRKAKLIAY